MKDLDSKHEDLESLSERIDKIKYDYEIIHYLELSTLKVTKIK